MEPETEAMVRAYLIAKIDVVDAGYEHEITWQESVEPDLVTPAEFLREAAWVVLCSGMREAVVRRLFPLIGAAMKEWEPEQVTTYPKAARREALRVFGHELKIDSIIRISQRLAAEGVSKLVDAVRKDGPLALTQLPFVGRVTCYHLAKNLGFQVAKPDRHLIRIATEFGCGVDDLCAKISGALDESVPVVDIVLWRYATLDPNYLTRFGESNDVIGYAPPPPGG